MSKPLLGLLLGGVLGLIDGVSAMIDGQTDPEVREGIVGIIIGSTFKGLIVGVATGFVARKWNSLTIGICFGVILGAILAFLVAYMQGKYYLRITLPGAVMGAIVGFVTCKYGAAPKRVLPANGDAQ
jgi:hypothetical protein